MRLFYKYCFTFKTIVKCFKAFIQLHFRIRISNPLEQILAKAFSKVFLHLFPFLRVLTTFGVGSSQDLYVYVFCERGSLELKKEVIRQKAYLHFPLSYPQFSQVDQRCSIETGVNCHRFYNDLSSPTPIFPFTSESFPFSLKFNLYIFFLVFCRTIDCK